MLTLQRKPYFLSTLLLRIILLLLLGWYLLRLLVPAGNGTVVRDIYFQPGSSIKKLAVELESAGIIRSSRHLVLAGRLRGQAHRLQAGYYRLSDSMTTGQILKKIAAGDVDFRRFTLPEGYSMYQAAELLDQQGHFKKGAFLEACRSTELLSRLKIAGSSAEGYLFPATYNLPHQFSEEQLVALMVEKFEKEFAALEAGAKKSGLNRHELLTLASMIEKEAVTADEKPLIASVFHNRLRIGMPLQSDPTAVYGVRAFAGKVSKADILRPSPYNTYLIKGLPPGPIGNPGIDALRAALHPAESGYLYFVARKDGTHQFSRSLEDHNRAVARYLR